jgi:hypothetical protein
MFFGRRAPQHDQTPCPDPSECEVPETKELTPEEIAEMRELMRLVKNGEGWDAQGRPWPRPNEARR